MTLARNLRILSLTSLAALGGGCGGAGGVQVLNTVAELRGNPALALSIEFSDETLGSLNPPDAGRATQVVFGGWSHSSANAPCPVLGADAALSLNGRALKAASLGESFGSGCVVPSWDIDNPGALQPSIEITLTDSTGSLVADFVNVMEPRTVTAAAADGGVVRAGEALALTLSPTTDEFPTSEDDARHFGWLNVDFVTADGGYAGGAAAYQLSTGLTPVTVPSGAVAVRIAEFGTVGTTRCDVGHCDLEFDTTTPDFPLALAP